MSQNDEWTTVTAADQVTEEILSAAESIHDGWPDETWSESLDRLDGIVLADGTKLDLGMDMGSPAIKRIKKHIGDYRKL